MLLCLVAPIQAGDYTAYAWAAANISLMYPANWQAPVTAGDDTLTLSGGAGGETITLVVLPISTADAALRPALENQLAALKLLPLQYVNAPLYGRGGLRIDAVSADRQQVGVGRSGRLPDGHGLLIAAGAPAAASDALQADLQTMLDSVAFSADLPPVSPRYQAVWQRPPDQVVRGIAAAGDRLYALEPDSDGVRVIDAATQAEIAFDAFDHPAQPTGIAVDGAGTVYVADTVCRCVRRLSPEGKWLDPVGSFGGGAPYSLAVAPDGTIYATDKTEAGYVLRILGEPRNRVVGLDFNNSAPPLVTVDAQGQAWVIEWLASLIDGSITAAVSQISGDAKPQADLRFWLAGLSPEKVSDLAITPDGDLALVTVGQGIWIVDPASGSIIDQFLSEFALRALTFGADGTLYTAGTDGSLSAFSTHLPALRLGNSQLTPGVPVQGTMSENNSPHSWSFDGTAGEVVTLSAVDLARTDVYAIGLDVALHLIAPSGAEIASNDDQVGDDLFGVYDAQIPAFTLPETGVYQVKVEWRQGSGTYTLGLSDDQPIVLSTDGVTQIEGRVQDVFPTQRWTFAGKAGQVLTFTMKTESGTLDPFLTLLKPDGSLLAFNDDAADPALDKNAQMAQVSLPTDGMYTVEASRYEGVGRYSLVIVETAQN